MIENIINLILNLMKKNILILILLLLVATPAFASEALFYIYSNNAGVETFKKNFSNVDVLAPQIYEVGYDLKITGPRDKKLSTVGKSKKVKVVPLIVNKSFDKALMTQILDSEEAKNKIISFMLSEAKKKKYAGWQFDFENLSHLDRDAYTSFVEKAGKSMKEANLEFSVAVVPRSDDYNPNDKYQDWSSGYDYKALSENSDFLSVMSYDDPNSVGPVASMPFLIRIYDYLTKKVEPEKLSMGIPLYCWHWQKGFDKKLESLSYYQAKKLKKETKAKEIYDEELEAVSFVYKKDGLEHKIWCENGKSFAEKLKLIDQYGMRGFSAWALGGEDDKIWKAVRDWKKN